MELIYLWVEKYNHIDNLEINFKPHILGIKKRNNEITLNKFDKEKSSSDFFKVNGDKQNYSINDITAIVGKNGSGKTSVLKVIYDVLEGYYLNKSLDNIKIYQKVIFIIKNDQKFKIYHTFGNEDGNNNGELIIKHQTELKLAEIYLDYSSRNIPLPRTINPIKKVVYFSNVFDANNWEIQSESQYSLFGQINISTNYLLFNRVDKLDDLKLPPDNISSFKSEEIEREINFNLSPDFKLLYLATNLKIPQVIRCNIFELRFKEPYFERLAIRGLISEDDCKDFTDHMAYNLLKVYLIYNQNNTVGHNPGEPWGQKYFSETFPSDTINQVKVIDVVINYFINEENNAVSDFLNFVKANFDNKSILYKSERYITINSSSQFFRDFFFKYKAISIAYKEFITFDYYQLSSGEKHFLSFFARFYWLVKKGTIKADDKNNLIILLDEPDLYLHPEWQRGLIEKCIIFFRALFKNSSIQLIIASHSPMILSDIPATNVIKIESEPVIVEGKDMIKILQNEKKSRTFAANIYDLYQDDFFLKYFMGEFAKNKIIAIDQELKSDDDIIPERYSEIKNEIEQIGDNIIREHLLSILKDKEGLVK